MDLIDIVRAALDTAETVWVEHGELLERGMKKASAKLDSVPSYIPGHPVVHEGEAKVGPFIALVADMRGSSNHLLVARKGRVTQLQRVYYETSALLPALAWQIDKEGGSVTEYLGDGVLALFDGSKRPESIYAASRAARGCISTVRDTVNGELRGRYDLPDIDIGVGLAYSQCVVHLVGLDNARHPKAIGKCVYYATKLSTGTNAVWVDSALEALWPSEKDGVIRFTRFRVPKQDFDAFQLSEKK